MAHRATSIQLAEEEKVLLASRWQFSFAPGRFAQDLAHVCKGVQLKANISQKTRVIHVQRELEHCREWNNKATSPRLCIPPTSFLRKVVVGRDTVSSQSTAFYTLVYSRQEKNLFLSLETQFYSQPAPRSGTSTYNWQPSESC